MNFLIKSASVAIATTTLLISQPVLANDHHSTTPSTSKTTKVVATTKDNIVQVAVANGSFKTLVAAVKAAGLVDTLSSKGPFTVFAPTDAAFAKLPPGTVENLLKPENKAALVKFLTYHVVGGKAIAAKSIKAGSTLVKTVDGGSVKVTKTSKGVVIDNSKVITADVPASNGVIHVIDSVLLPPDLQ
ncbi:fasciclin domain-containing protein [Pseudanabaena sp. FACHB-1998]|uniref:fasciclin domain-containing protein n=1 Tax=Pseudanabaena sp. FACHB-1998 TaxID=2692858 RepID=UPI0016814304|nr:fasciclin domain-containing protein [Pseudanabaena sp. FACHB-1998]MBD2179018.1 fasciclin domain-containing protein [Pseudanabaena sp. FACHB-1998]